MIDHLEIPRNSGAKPTRKVDHPERSIIKKSDALSPPRGKRSEWGDTLDAKQMIGVDTYVRLRRAF